MDFDKDLMKLPNAYAKVSKICALLAPIPWIVIYIWILQSNPNNKEAVMMVIALVLFWPTVYTNLGLSMVGVAFGMLAKSKLKKIQSKNEQWIKINRTAVSGIIISIVSSLLSIIVLIYGFLFILSCYKKGAM